MLQVFTAVSAIVPSLLLIWYFHSRDVYREPARVLWATFGLGILTVIPVLIVALPVGKLLEGIEDPYVLGVSQAFLTAAIPEEALKLTVLLGYCARHKEFDEPMDGIVYGVVASLGFATLENVLYVTGGGLGVAVARAATAVPGHAFLGALMGYYVGQAKFSHAGRSLLVATGFVIAVVLHGLYDVPIMVLSAAQQTGGEPTPTVMALLLLVPAVLIFEGVWVIRLTRRLRADQLALLAAPPPLVVTDPPLVVTDPSATAAPARTGFVAWILMIAGGLLATLGGLITLGLVLGMVVSPPDADEWAKIALGGAIIALLPLGIGILLFARGVARMRRDRGRQ